MMIKYRFSWLGYPLGVLICLPLSAEMTPLSIKKPNVLFINPVTKDSRFWNTFTRIMQVVANDLGVELSVVYAHNRLELTSTLKEALNKKEKPDYVISLIQRHSIKNFLDIIEKHKIPFISINTDVIEDERYKIGKPREKYKYWIGQLLPDDETVGYLLAKQLYTLAVAQSPSALVNGKYQMFAITGTRDSSSSFERNKGLMRFVNEQPALDLRQLVFSDWKMSSGKNIASRALIRYPDINIFWCASDGLALGAISALPQESEILTGGVDWSTQGVQSIRDDKLSVSIGGHILESVWSIILVLDHFNGRDFINELGNTHKIQPYILNQDNISKFPTNINWEEIDFTQHSKTFNHSRSKYTFHNIISEMNK
jgi:ABC-type sugar transport system substrate-binding protein